MIVDEIYNKDCIEGMKEIPDESIDLIVTDSPYLMNYKTGWRKNKKHKFTSTILNDNNFDLVAIYISECYRILKNNCACYMFCNVNHVDFFKTQLERVGFNIKNMIVWVKNNHTAGDLVAQYGKKYELVFYCNKGRAPIRGKRISDVWEFPRVSCNNLLHQNQKPIELIKQCVEKSSDKDAIVFDGFMGSATTAIACLETGRHYIGYELDSDYYKIACNRVIDWILEH